MASKTTVRVLGFLIFAACVVVAGVGIWYVRGGGLPQEDDDIALEDEDEDDEVDPKADGGARQRPKKKPGQRRGKPHGARQPAPRAAAGPSGMSYEAAIAGNNVHLTPGVKGAPDLTDAQL